MPDAPLALISAGFALAGGAKLADTDFTRQNFDRWGLGQRARFAVGAVEVGLAVTALAGQRSPEARPVVALGTLATMAGAAATHARAGDAAPNYVPVALLTAAALAVLRGG